MANFKILHLSDAHIGNPKWTTDRTSVMRPLVEDIRSLSQNDPPHLIVFSGDLVYGEIKESTMETQFEEASAWLNDIHSIWGKKVGDVPLMMVPGNHDIQRSEVDETQVDWLHSQSDGSNIESKMKENSKLWKRMLSRQNLWWRFFKDVPNQQWTYNEDLKISATTIKHENSQIGIVGYNSSWGCSEKGEKGKLWFTKHQFQTGFQMVDACTFRIAIVHHPLSWFHPNEEMWLLGKFQTHFQLVLHGHLHTTWYTAQANNVVISAGACYASSEQENGYSWIVLEQDCRALELTARTYYDKGKGEWAATIIPGLFDRHGKIHLLYDGGEMNGDLNAEESREDQKTNIATIVGTADVTRSFPSVPQPNVDRSLQLELLSESFSSSTHLLLLTGSEGVGKTILAAQFANRFPLFCLCAFISPSPNWSAQLSNIRFDLCNQISWLLNYQELAREVVSDSKLEAYLHKLQNYGRAKRHPVYIIVDGLNHYANTTDAQRINDVLSIFEGFLDTFYYVVTLPPEFLPKQIRQITYHTFSVPRFNEEQSKYYIGDLLDENKCKEVWALTKGHPASLSSIRRILKREPQTPIDGLPTRLPELIEREWKQVDEDNSNQLLFLAAVSLFPNRFNEDNLITALNIPASEIQYGLRNLAFLEVSSLSGNISFTSEPVRLFVARRLKRFESSIRDAILRDLMRHPDASQSLEEIPDHLHKAGLYNELLTYLSPDHLEKLLQQSHSWQQIIQKTDLAFDVALKKENIREYARFALHKSSLNQFKDSNPGRAEIDALIALGKWNDAVTFAESQIAKENRLLLIAIVARAAREKNYLLSADVTASITKLVGELNTSVSSEQRLDIATELIHVYPELSIRLVESAAGDKANIDSALVDISVRALFGQKKQNKLLEDSLEDISSKIEDERTRQFTESAQIIRGESTATSALGRIKKVKNLKDQIFLLRQWCIGHHHSEDALPLIEYALDLTVKTTDFVITAKALRELASPLPFASKNYHVLVVLSRFSDQASIVREKGFTIDYVTLQMILAQTELSYNESGFSKRLESLYFYTLSIEDLSIRTACIAIMCERLRIMKTMDDDKTLDTLFRTLSKDLDVDYEKLLVTTADHYTSTRDIIRTVQTYDANKSFSFVQKLNTEPRRNQAFADIAVNESRRSLPAPSVLQEAIDSINYSDLRESTVVHVVDELVKKQNNSVSAEVFDLLSKEAKSTNNVVRRCALITDLIAIHHANRETIQINTIDEMYIELNKAWESIDDVAIKRRCGFEIASAIAESSPAMAIRYWTAANNVLSAIKVSDSEYVDTVFHSILLAIRFYRGLIPKKLASRSDQDHIVQLINKMPSLAKRARLLGQLAFAYLRHDRRSAEGAAIANDYLHPLLDQIATKDRNLYELSFIELCPILYITHSASTRQRIQALDASRRDYALARIMRFILEKVNPEDPFGRDEHHDYKLTFNEISEVIELLGLVENDSSLFWYIRVLCDTIGSPRGKKTFSQSQQTEFVTQLKHIITTKLPNPKFIQHAGYEIVAKAELGRITGHKDEDLNKLIEAARALSNVADRVFVLALIATSISTSRNSLARELLAEAIKLVPGITTYEDRIERYDTLATIALPIDRPLAFTAYRNAIVDVTAVENWRGQAHARKLVDAAYRIDKSLAEEVALRLDTDPARTLIVRTQMKLETEKSLRKKITENSDLVKEVTLDETEQLSEAAWLLLGEINAGKAPALKLPRCRDMIRVASRISFSESYQLWIFIAENLVSQYANTDQAASFLRPLFDAAITNSELTQRIASSSFSDSNSVDTPIEEYYTGAIIIAPGAKHKALEEIERWCSEQIQNYVIVVDPSFRKEDLSLIEIIRRSARECHIIVLASKAMQSADGSTISIEESYKSYWSQTGGSLDPGSVEIILVGASLTGELPVSERMLLSNRGGLRFSAAYSQLGIGAESTIHSMSVDEATLAEQELEPFLDQRRSRLNNQPFSITRFTLY